MTTQGHTEQLGKGFETRTFTCFFEQGNGWRTKCFTTWKGKSGGELNFSNTQWFDNLRDCESDCKTRSNECRDLGFK